MRTELESSFAASFAPGLTDPTQAAPTDVTASAQRGGCASKGVIKRYNVYRNNVTVSLINALASIYPAVQRITGVDFFRAMARFYLRATPPTSPLLFEYGRDFPDFIAAYPYAAELPWLADTARIERAWLDAYHAADVPVLDAVSLAAIPPNALPDLTLVAHPATRLIRSPYPAVSIFAMNRGDGPITKLESAEAQDALVTRPLDDVVVSHLPAGAAIFLGALLDGAPLGTAASAAFTAVPDFDLGAHMAAMVDAGMFAAFSQETAS
jgi:Putative DNA-binding domain